MAWCHIESGLLEIQATRMSSETREMLLLAGLTNGAKTSQSDEKVNS